VASVWILVGGGTLLLVGTIVLAAADAWWRLHAWCLRALGIQPARSSEWDGIRVLPAIAALLLGAALIVAGMIRQAP
jgi:hypothetical protein